MLTAPAMQREGYAQVAAADISIETLIGKSVYGADDSDVGTVDDVIVDDSGAIREVIIDFGGFLGMGATQVALTFEELSILTNVENTDIRVYVDATKEQVEAMPVYTPAN
jgi:sporulation protein YlmC with PRC-barrel domain